MKSAQPPVPSLQRHTLDVLEGHARNISLVAGMVYGAVASCQSPCSNTAGRQWLSHAFHHRGLTRVVHSRVAMPAPTANGRSLWTMHRKTRAADHCSKTRAMPVRRVVGCFATDGTQPLWGILTHSVASYPKVSSDMIVARKAQPIGRAQSHPGIRLAYV
jgi:hypothetical protein